MSKKISVILFALIILIIPIASLFSPYKTVSLEENRKLASFPEFTAESVVSKKFMSGFSDFVSDHIVLRDQWIVLKEKISTALGKRDNNGIYLCGDRLIQKVEEPKPGVYKRNITAVNDFAKKTGKETYVCLVPTAAEIQRERLPAYAPTLDQAKFIKEVSNKLDGVKLIDVSGALLKHKNEYIYYRTDHHWTTLGAFYCYTEAAKQLGFTPLAQSDFKIRNLTDSFNGTLYSKSGSRDVKQDTIELFEPQNGFNLKKLTIGLGDSAKTYNSILFNDKLDGKNKYEVFFNGNQPIEKIETGNSGKKLLVIKDSYAHAFVPFLMNHYSEITMLDMRYLNCDVDEVVKTGDYDQILFLYNVDDFASDRTIANVE